MQKTLIVHKQGHNLHSSLHWPSVGQECLGCMEGLKSQECLEGLEGLEGHLPSPSHQAPAQIPLKDLRVSYCVKRYHATLSHNKTLGWHSFDYLLIFFGRVHSNTSGFF